MINVAAWRRKQNLSAVEYWTKLPISLRQTHCWLGTANSSRRSMMALPSEDLDGRAPPAKWRIWWSDWLRTIAIGVIGEFSVPCQISDTVLPVASSRTY